MTGLIPFVIVIFLANVQASSITILPKEFENEDDSNRVEKLLTLEESDEKGRMETIDIDFQFPLWYQDVMAACSDNTCKFCLFGVCPEIKYLEKTNEISVCLKLGILPSFCKTIAVKELFVDACGGLRGLRISDGKVCVDLKVSVAGINFNVPTICIPL